MTGGEGGKGEWGESLAWFWVFIYFAWVLIRWPPMATCIHLSKAMPL